MMAVDPKFLEFWGSTLLAAARGQQQLVRLGDWPKGLKDIGELSRRFAEIYGLPRPADHTPDAAETWKAAEEQFQRAFRQFLKMIDVVPASRHRALEKKNAVLQHRVEELEERLANLEKHRPAGAAEGFSQLMRQQQHQFQRMMQSFSDLLGHNEADNDGR